MLSATSYSKACVPADNVLVNWVNDLLVPLLAAGASAAAIIVALDQLTAMARLRRRTVFWREQRQSTPLSRDAEVFHSLEREAAAMVIALQAYPARKLFLPAFGIISGSMLAWQVGYTAGAVPPAELSWDKLQGNAAELGGDLSFLIIVPSLTMFGLVTWLNLLVARARLVHAYLEGENLESQEVSSAANNWPAGETLGGWGLLALFVFSCGTVFLAALFGASAAMRDQRLSPVFPPWITLLLIAGTFGLMAGVVVYVNVAESIKTSWVHPRRLSERAGQLHEANSHRRGALAAFIQRITNGASRDK